MHSLQFTQVNSTKEKYQVPCIIFKYQVFILILTVFVLVLVQSLFQSQRTEEEEGQGEDSYRGRHRSELVDS